MTCIVALEHDGRVYMGADKAGSNGFTTMTVEAAKIFDNGRALLGICGSFRMGQLLQYGLYIPTDTLGWDVDRWVATDLMQALRRTYAAHGWDYVEKGVAEGGNFLFAIGGRCYEIQSDYSLLRAETGEYAIGSGTYHALGSLHSTRDWAKPKQRVKAALEAAAEHVVSVGGPFDVRVQAAS